jgi:hypothetical protein
MPTLFVVLKGLNAAERRYLGFNAEVFLSASSSAVVKPSYQPVSLPCSDLLSICATSS